MRVLAIDPGYERLGIAIVEKNGAGKDVLVHSDCFTTNKKHLFSDRLEQIGREIERLIAAHQPNVLAMERLYFNSNQKTAMMVAEVRGAIIYLATARGLALREYTPSQVKSAVIGYGKGTKDQVAKMVRQLITITKDIAYDDEYDAIAVGLTCTASERE